MRVGRNHVSRHIFAIIRLFVIASYDHPHHFTIHDLPSTLYDSCSRADTPVETRHEIM